MGVNGVFCAAAGAVKTTERPIARIRVNCFTVSPATRKAVATETLRHYHPRCPGHFSVSRAPAGLWGIKATRPKSRCRCSMADTALFRLCRALILSAVAVAVKNGRRRSDCGNIRLRVCCVSRKGAEVESSVWTETLPCGVGQGSGVGIALRCSGPAFLSRQAEGGMKYLPVALFSGRGNGQPDLGPAQKAEFVF